MNPLALLVEGQGDSLAVPNLVSRLLNALPVECHGFLHAGAQPLVVGELPRLSGTESHIGVWQRYLQRATTGKRKAPAVLAVFDGDMALFEGQPFCAATAARAMADRARVVGAGTMFSLAVVLLLQEYESLLIAAADQLPDLDPNAARPANPEAAPRGAKGWLDLHLPGGYSPTVDQLRLTQCVQDFQPLRDRMRCFRRLEKAVHELATAVSTGQHVCTPCLPATA